MERTQYKYTTRTWVPIGKTTISVVGIYKVVEMACKVMCFCSAKGEAISCVLYIHVPHLPTIYDDAHQPQCARGDYFT